MPAGSQATWAPGDSRVCCVCGGKLAIGGPDALWIHYDVVRREHRSSHVRCGSPLAPDDDTSVGEERT